jgi:hypothetical protein
VSLASQGQPGSLPLRRLHERSPLSPVSFDYSVKDYIKTAGIVA